MEESGSTSRQGAGRTRRAFGILAAVCAVGIAGCGGGERQDEDEPEGEFPVEVVAAEFPTKQRLAQTSELTLSIANAGDEALPELAITVFTEANDDSAADDAATGAGTDDSGSASATDAEGEAIPEEQLDEAVDEALREELEEQGASEDEDSSEDETTGTEGEQELPVAEGAFYVISRQEGLAVPSRPVWILEQGFPRIAGTEAGPAPPGELSGAGGAEAAQSNTFAFGELAPNETREVVFRVTPVQPGTYTVRYRVAAGLQGKAVAVNQDGSVPEGEFVVQISDVPPQTRVDDAGNVVPIRPGDIIGQAGTKEQKRELGQ
ncbi:MAG: hypothetical protein ACRDKH_05035 [Solirubrobacterales bacterium]